MAQKFRPNGPRSGSARNIIARFVSIAAISATSYMSMVGDVRGPVFDSGQAPPRAVASVDFSGNDPIFSASVDRIFQSSAFVGPNRAQKTDRLRNNPDVIEFSRSFNKARLLLAQLRASDPPAPGLKQTTGAPGSQAAPPVFIAAVDPALTSNALAAIAKATPVDPLIPRPGVISSRLAYARAVAPTTEKVLNSYSERDRWCLSTAIYFEARGESYRGQVAVAQVVMNRVKHPLYPATICGVVFQNQSWRDRCQFSFACDGKPERVTDPKAWARAQEITQKVTTGKIYLTEVANATHYHANYVHPDWAKRMDRVTTIGTHIFYRFRS